MSTTSLTGKVYNLLEERKPELAENFKHGFNGTSSTDEEEVKLLNRYFRAVLATAPVSTVDERGCLMDNLAPDTWLKYFKSHALPTLLRFDLPAQE